jgi:renalase
MQTPVAIIGGGIAGLAAARMLRDAGMACTIFDKSRGLGGRMATRRVDAWQFDHGAQYFTARGPRFRATVDAWRRDGHAAEWFDGAFVGTPGMTRPARAMAQGVEIVAGCQVAGLRRTGAGWSLLAADGPVATPDNGSFAAVILAVPAPQARPLAESAGVMFPALADVRYAPCWALMLGFAADPGPAQTHIRDTDGDVAWIARNSSKPGRPHGVHTFVAHAGAGWSRRNLELSADSAGRDLWAQARRLSEFSAEPVFAVAHRWRYALVENPAGDACLWDATACVGACGDWCLGPRVESAFDSGEALARNVLSALAA